MNIYPLVSLEKIPTGGVNEFFFMPRVSFVKKEGKENLPFYYEKLNCRLVDFVQLDDKYSFVVDDEGLFESDNPVWDIEVKGNQPSLQLVGSLLLVKNVVTEKGIESIGFADEKEAQKHYNELFSKIRLVGYVK